LTLYKKTNPCAKYKEICGKRKQEHDDENFTFSFADLEKRGVHDLLQFNPMNLKG
jgi:hypothetical protein